MFWTMNKGTWNKRLNKWLKPVKPQVSLPNMSIPPQRLLQRGGSMLHQKSGKNQQKNIHQKHLARWAPKKTVVNGWCEMAPPIHGLTKMAWNTSRHTAYVAAAQERSRYAQACSDVRRRLRHHVPTFDRRTKRRSLHIGRTQARIF